MHVPGFAADEGFVKFALSNELRKRTGMNRLANALQEAPRRFLSDVEMACDLVTADAVLASDKQPNGQHPLVHAKRRILEDAADFDGELLLTALAEPDAAGADERVLFRPAAWTFDAVRPTQGYCPFVRLLGIAQVENRLLQALGEFAEFAIHAPLFVDYLCVSSNLLR